MFAPALADTRDGFDPKAFDDLARLEASSFWFRARNKLVLQLMREEFRDARDVLEIGCGTGYVLQALAAEGLRVAGSDLHPAGLAHAQDRAGAAELLQIDARHLPFDSEWDVVGAFDVLEHIEEDERVLREMYRAVRPGGGILISVPQHRWLWSLADDYAQHVRRYARAELVAKVTSAGFVMQRVTSFVSTLLPLMAFSRLRERHSADPYDPTAEFRLPRRLDRALERVLDVERVTIGRGASLPAGGSLFVVARRPSLL